MFCLICHKHVPNAKSKKMIYDESEVMKLVVYHKKGAYTLYNSISGKSMIIRDVVIDEKEL